MSCDYALAGGNTVTFSLPKGYNHALPLVIDPVLVYSSYTNSTSNYGYTAAFDSLGNLYAGGSVFGPGYPTTVGAFQMNYNASIDMGIIKYNPAALTGPASRVYATYVGGNSDDHPHSLVVDHGNNLVIMGSTGSSNYPVTAAGFSRTFGGGGADIVVTKLNPAGSALVGSTYLGGSGLDGRTIGALSYNYGDAYRGDVTIDRRNNIYVASATASSNFPTSAGGFQLANAGGAADGIITKLNPGLTALVWSSYLGGSGVDMAYSVQVDSVSNVFVSGGTTSTNFPVTAGTLHSTYQGGTADGFVVRIVPTADAIISGTYLGTSAYDQAHFLQLNARDEVYVYGQTFGAYPVSAGVYSNPGSRQFIQKLNPTLTTSMMSTVIGNGTGTGANMSPTAFLVDNCGQIMLSGWTSQGGMPVTPDALQATGGSGNSSNNISGYFYIAQLADNARRLVYGTYFGNGGCHVDGGTSRFDKKGIIYQSMCAGSGNGPLLTTPNAWSRTNGDFYNNAAFKIDVAQLNAAFFPSIVATNNPQLALRELCAPANFVFNRALVAGTGARWDFGNGQTSTQSTGIPVTYRYAGKYAVRLTVYDSTSCQQSTSFVDTVQVLGLPRTAAGVDKTICPGGSATLTVSGAGPRATYAWSPSTGLSAATGATVVATPAVTTRYVVLVNIPGTTNCITSDTVVVRVRQPLAVAFTPLSASGAPQRRGCAPLALTFRRDTPQTGDTLRWDFGDGTTSTTANNVNHVYTRPGRYAVRLLVSDSTTCPGRLVSVDTITVYAVPRPQVTPASRALVCPGSATTLTANNINPDATSVTYTWTAPGQPTQTGASITLVPAATTLYTVTASTPANAGSCTSTDTVTVHVLPRVVVSAGPARDICPGAPVTLSVASAGPNARYTWTAPGQPTLSGQTVQAQPTASVRYRVVVENGYGCQGRDSVQVNVATRPVLAATVSKPNIVNEPVTFTNTSTGATSYRWDFGDNSPVSTETSPTHTYTVALQTPYQARLTAIYGPANCEETIVVAVPLAGFELPNVITPSGDGLNDTFRPFVTAGAVEIKIFNRWGRTVFEQSGYTGSWGADAPAGIYYYRMTNARGESWKGWIEVMR